MIRLLVASNNPGKIREYRELLAGLRLELTWPRQEGLDLEVEETGSTFAENARLKAAAYAVASGLWVLADDSGLEVDALNGAPGVYSARYGGPGKSDRDRYELVLRQLAEVPANQRAARFCCVIALASPGGQIWFAEGVCEGVITFEPRGEGGFGYDPIFLLPALGRTMAELAPEEKNRLSHRARAVAALKPVLMDKLDLKAASDG
jgi:XTP/dITP diphosphohydrolase